MKGFILFLIYFLLQTDSKAQDCRGVSTKKDKQKDIEIVGGVTNSEHFYSLLIRKEINRRSSATAPQYSLLLNAASRVALSDSMLKTTGDVELQLADSSIMLLKGATAFNNLLGIAFNIYLTGEQIQVLSQNPIVNMSVFGILKTSFSLKKQKEQQRIYSCLLSKK